MALTGGRIAANIYNIDGTDLKQALVNGVPNGVTQSFPNAGVLFYQNPSNGTVPTAFGVTMNSVIEVLPTGLRTKSVKYYTDSTISALLSNGS